MQGKGGPPPWLWKICIKTVRIKCISLFLRGTTTERNKIDKYETTSAKKEKKFTHPRGKAASK